METQVYLCPDRAQYFVAWELDGSEGELGGFDSIQAAVLAEDEWWANHG